MFKRIFYFSIVFFIVDSFERINCYGKEYNVNKKIKISYTAQLIDMNSNKMKVERRKKHQSIINDVAGRIIAIESKEKGKISYHYDELGNLIEIDKNGIEKEIYSYDILGRKTRIDYQSSWGRDTVYFKYSTSPESYLLGELSNKIEKYEISKFEYIKGKLVKEIKSILGRRFCVAYVYNDEGILKSVIYPSGMIIDYSYMNRSIKDIFMRSNKNSKMLYHKTANQKELIQEYGNGIKTIQKYDEKSKILSLKSENIMDWAVHYNEDGLINSFIDKINLKNNRTFYYDNEMRLIKANGACGNNEYQYNDLDDLIIKNVSNEKMEFKYDENDSRIKMLKLNGRRLVINYDKNGRIICIGNNLFEYNERGELSRIKKGEKVLVELFYNFKNQRVIERESNKNMIYVYDIEDHILGIYNEKGKPIKEYIYNGDIPFAFFQNNKMFYFHYDAMNFPIMVTDNNGKIVRKISYEPHGEIISEKGNVQDDLRYPGQFEIKKSGFFYNLNRTYYAPLGIYLEPDMSINNNENIYSYALGNPLLYYDLKGKFVYKATNLTIASAVEGGGICFVNGFAESKCFEKNGEKRYVCGGFHALISCLGGGEPISFSNVVLGKKFTSVSSYGEYPTMKEFAGIASIASGGVGAVVGVSLGSLQLGNVRNTGFSFNCPDLNCSWISGTGTSWIDADNDFCCRE